MSLSQVRIPVTCDFIDLKRNYLNSNCEANDNLDALLCINLIRVLGIKWLIRPCKAGQELSLGIFH